MPTLRALTRSPAAVAGVIGLILVLLVLVAALVARHMQPDVAGTAATHGASPTPPIAARPTTTPILSASPIAAPEPGIGWPYLTDADRLVGPTLAEDGTLYLGEMRPDGASVTALAPDGSTVDGWPVTFGESGVQELILDGEGPLLAMACTYGQQGRCALHRLTTEGRAVPGWPAAFQTGCGVIGLWDGRTYVACSNGETGTVTAIGADGREVEGWPISRPALSSLQLGSDGTLYVGGTYREPGTISALGANGSVLPGWPVSVPPYTDFTADRDRLYVWTYQGIPPDAQVADGPNCVLTEQTAFSALDRGGVPLPAWSHTVFGGLASPIRAPDGSLHVMLGDPSRVRLVELDPETWPPSQPGEGTGCWGMPVQFGPDANLYQAAGSQIQAWDREGAPLPGWPHSGDFQVMATCFDCLGSVPYPPAFGPDGTVYIATLTLRDFTPVETQVRAVAPDGTLKPGWPVVLETPNCRPPDCVSHPVALAVRSDGALVVMADAEWLEWKPAGGGASGIWVFDANGRLFGSSAEAGSS